MKIKSKIKVQLYIMIRKKSFRISFTIMMLYALTVYLLNIYSNMNMDISAILSASSLFILNDRGNYFWYFDSLFPFLVLFPFSFSYLNDKKTKMGMLLQVKMGAKDYYRSQMIACFLGGFLILFVPLMMNLILTNTTFIENGYTNFGYYNDIGYCQQLIGSMITIPTANTGMSFLEVYIFSPFLYNVLYTFFISIFAGLLGIFGLACSYLVKYNKVTLFIITYLLFLGTTKLNTQLSNSNQYVNTRLLNYVSVNISFGRSAWFFLGVCLILFLFSMIGVWRMSRLDQL